MPITHTKVSVIPDGPDANLIRPSDWNADHTGDHDPVTVGTGLDVTGQLVELDLSEVAAGGELAGFLNAPTVDATHSGSTHSASTDTHIADASDAHDASAISLDPEIVGEDDVQAALGILEGLVLSPHSAADVSFTPNGSIAATDVQAAIQEVRDEGGAGVLTSVTIDLTAADLATLNSVPVEVVPAPGVGFAIHPITQYSELIFGTEAYADVSIALRFDGGDDLEDGANVGAPSGVIDFSSVAGSFDTVDVENKALLIWAPGGDLETYGAIATSSLNAGGADWIVNDTFSVDAGIGNAASGVVDSVDGLGAVLTYHLTDNGTGYQVATGSSCSATSGIGTGLTIDIDSITPQGDGTYRITVQYATVPVG